MVESLEDKWKHRLEKRNEEMFTSDAHFAIVPFTKHSHTEGKVNETVEEGTKNIIAVIGDRFMNGGYLPAEVLEKSYKKWNSTLHDINHMGTSTGFFLIQTDITYFIGYHSNVKYDKKTNEISMELNIEDSCKYSSAWKAYVQLCGRAGLIPNVSVTYYGKRDWITASELPKDIPWKKEGYGKDDLVPVLNEITPICVSTVLQGRCNDKDGCGIRNDQNKESKIDPKLEKEIEEKRQELIKWLEEDKNR
jgi:hypothetical protein